MGSEALFKRIVDIGASGIGKAYETILGTGPGAPQTDYYSGEITPVAQVLPPPTSWDQFRLANDVLLRGVNGGGFFPIPMPVNAGSELINFNFSDTIANGQFHEYHFGPPPHGEIWRIHGVNFLFTGDAELTIQSHETFDLIPTSVTGTSQSGYFGQHEAGIFYPGPPATNVTVKAEPKPWDMIAFNNRSFNTLPFLLIAIQNDLAVGANTITFSIAITRMVRATAPTPPR